MDILKKFAATPTLTPAVSGNSSATIAPDATTGLDPALADISGEDDDSLPELDIPTPATE